MMLRPVFLRTIIQGPFLTVSFELGRLYPEMVVSLRKRHGQKYDRNTEPGITYKYDRNTERIRLCTVVRNRIRSS